MRGYAALIAALLVALTGCLSAEQSESGSESSPATQAAGPSDGRCAVLRTAQLQRVLGQAFTGPVNTADSSEAIAECQWTAESQAALVIVKLAEQDGRFLFEESAQNASRNLGQVVDVDIPGAQQAYGVPSLGRVGMLVSDSYVEVSTLVPGAAQAKIEVLAELAAEEAADG